MNDDRLPDAEGVIAHLERLGSESVYIGAERLGAIEVRVRAAIERHDAGELQPVVAAVDAPRVVRDSPRRARMALVAASVIFLAGLIVAALGTGDDTLVVSSADDAVVILPDGDAVDAVDGTQLPEDSVLDVSGFIEVGGRRYGAGRYRVDDGRIVPIESDTQQVRQTGAVTTVLVVHDGGRGAPATEVPVPTSPDTVVRPTVAPATTGPPPIETPTPQPPATRPAPTTPPRTTAPERSVPQRPPPTPTTTGPPATRPAVSDPPSTTTRPTTATTSSTTSTTIVRGRPAVDEPGRTP